MTVQSGLRTVTQNFPWFIERIGRLILGEACYESLIFNVSPDAQCLRLALSKGLGVGIIVFGSILKIPQIVTIVRHRSAWGISLTMYALEVVAYDISLAYAFRKRLPFSTYGENASLTVQNMIITLLIIWYQPLSRGSDVQSPARPLPHQRQRSSLLTAPTTKRTAEQQRVVQRHVTLSALAMAAGSVFLFILCPAGLLSVLQAFSIPISLLSKFPQIAELQRNKQCGHLSAIVVFAQLAGTLARVFTTVTETGDWLLGIGFGLASVLNAVIAVQYVYYWKKNGSHRSNTSLPLTASNKASNGGHTTHLAPRTMSGRIWNPSSSSDLHEKDEALSSVSIMLNGGGDNVTDDYNLPSSSIRASSGRHVYEKGRRED